MRKEPLKVIVSENSKVIGRLTPTEFMQYCDRPNRFLSDLIKDFNIMKEASGESTRVEVRLNK